MGTLRIMAENGQTNGFRMALKLACVGFKASLCGHLDERPGEEGAEHHGEGVDRREEEHDKAVDGVSSI